MFDTRARMLPSRVVHSMTLPTFKPSDWAANSALEPSDRSAFLPTRRLQEFVWQEAYLEPTSVQIECLEAAENLRQEEFLRAVHSLFSQFEPTRKAITAAFPGCLVHFQAGGRSRRAPFP